MDGARLGLQASLLVRSPETGELFVNFDPEILTQIREADCMSRMKLEVPPFASLLQQRQTSLKGHYNKLQVLFLLYIYNVIWDPAVLLCYSRTSGGRKHRAWAGNQKLQGAALRHVSYFLTEIFYRRKICVTG